ncbi:hypothetical protein AB5N19_05673 [Seiridium cardinale]|uniref:Uncharacterized protein n=1 Tax=Seiridium cardinale TaxID=138064 RepID=A0ABR2XJW5_9PEZI
MSHANLATHHGNGSRLHPDNDAILPDCDLVDESTHTGPHAEPAARPIPLTCGICPKVTKFSDVSHLLTHIASKGHLSNMFKLDIAKYTNDDARERLEDYQAWFDEYNIRELLQNRSENRVQKSSGSRGRGGTRGGTPAVSLRGEHGSVVNRNGSGRKVVAKGKQRVRDNSKSATHVNPIKREPDDDFESVSDFTPSSHAHVQRPWNPGHDIQAWPSLPPWNGAYFGHGFQQDMGFGIGQQGEERIANHHEDVETSSKYEPSDMEDEDEGDTSLLRSEDTMDTTIPEVDVQAVSEELELEERERVHFRKYLKGEIAKLEGVGGFDAAPEEQRRKRNQKKDPSVLVHMEASSRAVQTLEHVTDLNFSHVRWRDVYDDPSVNGSEDECNEPKPAKKSRRRSPKKTRGKVDRARAIKVEEATSRESSVASTTDGYRRGRPARNTRRASTRSSDSRTAPLQEPSQSSMPMNRLTRSAQAGMSSMSGGYSASGDGLPGRVRIGNRVVDVFRDNVDPLPSEGPEEDLQLHQRHDGLPGLALRPADVNLPLLSPTPLLKRHASARLFPGKENSRIPYQASSATTNPYLNNPESLDGSSFNPLCVQSRENSSVRGFSSYDI